MISKEEIKRLAELARIKIEPSEEESLAHDFEKILSYFEELKKLDTEDVLPVTGGTENKSVFREDKEMENNFNTDILKKQFPESEKGFLKVPEIFSNDSE